MANIGAFSAQIVAMVRSMPDEAILDLVKAQLGRFTSGAAAPVRAPRIPVAAAPRARRSKRSPGAPSAARAGALEAVERIVKTGSGVSASDVARAAGIPQTHAASALKRLKLAKRIFQGGDRRFARYAADSKTAQQASLNARQTASGPARKAKRGK